MEKDAVSFAKEFLENTLSFFGLNIDVTATMDEEVISLSVPSTRMNGFLIGQRGETMRALQALVANVLRNQGYEQSRISLDIADYKKHRQDRLAEEAVVWIDEAINSSQEKHLKPMSASDRRVIHKLISDRTDIESHSEGEGRDRHIVLVPVTKSDEA